MAKRLTLAHSYCFDELDELESGRHNVAVDVLNESLVDNAVEHLEWYIAESECEGAKLYAVRNSVKETLKSLSADEAVANHLEVVA